ncbi:rCG62937 [Rattus norvegicus]|uniref:RCG62937 n=1 Tax=Rattus norvegicus TaxID=10116 RepID=A6JSI3_RAT|nr:rCG62937 [Rattus norvegicus]
MKLGLHTDPHPDPTPSLICRTFNTSNSSCSRQSRLRCGPRALLSY